MDTLALLILTLVIAWTVLYGFYRLAIYVVELDDSTSRRKHTHSARPASTKSGA